MQLDLKFIEMEKEVWKDIIGYEGLYQVSNLGRVKSLNYKRTGQSRILKPSTNNGYKQVILHKDGHQYTYTVHSLVMKAFVGERPEGMDIDHKDSVRFNNRLENLRYVSSKENVLNPNSSIIRPISQYTLQGEHIKDWNSVIYVEMELGYDRSNITKCCKGKRKTAYGYKWMYLSDYNKEGTVA